MTEQTAKPEIVTHATLRTCECGNAPVLKAGRHRMAYMVQVTCKCGEHTALLTSTDPDDQAYLVQSIADSWNLGPNT